MPRAPELTRPETVNVAAGILRDAEGRVLLSDRAQATSLQDHWEFPGGKIRAGESAADALRRELAEELGIQIAKPEFFCTTRHDYEEFRVAIDFYLVTGWQGSPTGVEGQSLRWVGVDELASAGLLPADEPLIRLLKEL
ncbi:MAG: 8-oxo-dGTP diphosphatase MutT [Woeseiaceae bacterium]|nr:8-oxo-dGTP diphosphatase MutT [Woeseiaceae bacterium]